MRYLFYMAVVLLLFVIQTVVMPDLPGFVRVYDLIIPLAVFFSLYRPFAEGLPVILIAGIMMDMVSGAPIGIYLIIYLWLFVAFRRVWRWIRVSGSLLFPVVVMLGVLFENFIFWMALSLKKGLPLLSANAGEIIGYQLLWAVLTAPVLLVLLKGYFAIVDQFGGGALPENGHSGF